MTVRREKLVRVDCTEGVARAATERVLQSHKEYRVTGRSADRWELEIRPRIWPLLLATRVSIELHQSDTDSGVSVALNTSSQPLIFGDVFGMYNRYLDRFAQRLHEEVARASSNSLSIDQRESPC